MKIPTQFSLSLHSSYQDRNEVKEESRSQLYRSLSKQEDEININKGIPQGSRTDPQDPAWQLENNSALTTEEKTQLANHLAQKEHDAFGKFAKQSPPDLTKYYTHYLNYLNSLSGKESSADRYAGQSEKAEKLLDIELAKEDSPTNKRTTKRLSLINYIDNYEISRSELVKRRSAVLESPNSGKN